MYDGQYGHPCHMVGAVASEEWILHRRVLAEREAQLRLLRLPQAVGGGREASPHGLAMDKAHSASNGQSAVRSDVHSNMHLQRQGWEVELDWQNNKAIFEAIASKIWALERA